MNTFDIEKELIKKITEEITKQIDRDVIESFTGVKFHDHDGSKDYSAYYKDFEVHNIKYVTTILPPRHSSLCSPLPTEFYTLELYAYHIKVVISAESLTITYEDSNPIVLTEHSTHIGMNFKQLRSFFITAIEDYAERTIGDMTNWQITE